MPTWIAPTEVTPGTASAWTDVDVSSDIPSDATGVILHIDNTNAATNPAIGVRKNGSSDNRTDAIADDSHQWAAIGVDGNQIFEAFVGSTTDVDIFLVGYTLDEAVFFDNAINESLANNETGAWTDIDISGSTGTDTAIGAFFETTAGGETFGFRDNGSTDDRRWHDFFHLFAVIGVDVDQICEGWIAHRNVDFFLNGYLTKDSVFNTNATDVTPSAVDTWEDITTLPAGGVGGYIEVASNFSDAVYGLRENGSTEAILLSPARHPWGYVSADSSRIIEGRMGSTLISFWLVGYSEATAAGGVVISERGPFRGLSRGTWRGI